MDYEVDFTVANIENSARGFGFSESTYSFLRGIGIDAFTSGNHVYSNKQVMDKFDQFDRLVRPMNFPPNNPGLGSRVIVKNGVRYGLVNLIGRIFMGPADCPFQCIKSQLGQIKSESDVIIVDFHTEATSEMQAMGWFLSKDVSIVFGTHTHVQTSDDRLLDNHTAYVTDIGMVGSENSVIGMKKDPVVKRFFDQQHVRYEPAEDPPYVINGMICHCDTTTGKVSEIIPIKIKDSEGVKR